MDQHASQFSTICVFLYGAFFTLHKKSSFLQLFCHQGQNSRPVCVCISGGEACFDWPVCCTLLACRKTAVPAGAVCFTPLRRNSVLPKITRLLNEFPSVFSLAMLSLRPGTPPVNWSVCLPLPSPSSCCSVLWRAVK